MAALVKVNGLEAYMLLDSGSMTILIMHDFAQVVKLKVMQLENLVPLQLGMVGSCFMINVRSVYALASETSHVTCEHHV